MIVNRGERCVLECVTEELILHPRQWAASPTVVKLFSLLTLVWNGSGQLDSFLKVRERSYSCKLESLYLFIKKKLIKTAYL